MSEQGPHRANQDRALIVSPFQLQGVATHDSFIIGVFDGRFVDGEQMSDFAARKLPTMAVSGLGQHRRPLYVSTVKEVLTSTFRRINEEGPNLQSAGSTASVAVRLGNMLYLANVGDSITFLATYDDINRRALIIKETERHTNRMIRRTRSDRTAWRNSKGGRLWRAIGNLNC